MYSVGIRTWDSTDLACVVLLLQPSSAPKMHPHSPFTFYAAVVFLYRASSVDSNAFFFFFHVHDGLFFLFNVRD